MRTVKASASAGRRASWMSELLNGHAGRLKAEASRAESSAGRFASPSLQ